MPLFRPAAAGLEMRHVPFLSLRTIVLFRGKRQQALPELLPCLRRVDQEKEAVMGEKLPEGSGKKSSFRSARAKPGRPFPAFAVSTIRTSALQTEPSHCQTDSSRDVLPLRRPAL